MKKEALKDITGFCNTSTTNQQKCKNRFYKKLDFFILL